MSIFTKPASQLASSDLQELLQDAAVENIRLEFKSQAPDKDETLKKLTSFANSFGGFMVVGAKANSTDGRIQDLPGIDQQPGYKQKIVQWCFDGTSPPLIVEVSDAIPTPNGNGRVCHVIYTAESEVAPHFLNGRKGVWVRTDEFSQRYEPQLATENEIRHLLDRRRLVIERRVELRNRSRRRFETVLSRHVPEDENEPSKSSPPRVEVSFGPRFPARPVCEHTQLISTLQNTRVNWRQTSFPKSSSNCVSQHESVLFLTPRGMVEANIWGLLFYGTELEIEIGPKQTGGLIRESINGIHLYRLVGYLLVFTKHAKQVISSFGYEGPLSVEITLSGILGVQWLYSVDGIGMYSGPVSELDSEFSFSLPTTTESLKDRPDALVRDMLQYILFGMNWADYACDSGNLDALLRSGYKYNSWGDPLKLRL